MVVISLSLGLFGVFGTLRELATLGAFGTMSVPGIGAQVLSPFFDREPLVVPLGPGAEILQKIQVGRRCLSPLRLLSPLSLLRVRRCEPAARDRERRTG